MSRGSKPTRKWSNKPEYYFAFFSLLLLFLLLRFENILLKFILSLIIYNYYTGDEEMAKQTSKLLSNIQFVQYENCDASWETFIEILCQQFCSTGIVEDKQQKAILLSNIGVQTYVLLKTLLSPELPADKTFAEIVEVLNQHLVVKPNFLMERYHFRRRHQQTDESVKDYITVLKKMAMTCQFNGDTLSEALRDQIVLGVCSSQLRERLFTEKSPTLEVVTSVALTYDSAKREVASMLQVSEVSPSVNVVKKSVSSCYCCGARGHLRPNCPKKETAYCTHCKIRGHLITICRKYKNIKHTR